MATLIKTSQFAWSYALFIAANYSGLVIDSHALFKRKLPRHTAGFAVYITLGVSESKCRALQRYEPKQHTFSTTARKLIT